jgi:CHASE2 domain-containing sensor protein
MSKLIIISLGNGNLHSGFSRVTAQLWTPGHTLPEQFVGSLPPAPFLIELYQRWQALYRALCNRQSLRSFAPLDDSDDDLDIDKAGITNVSQANFEELCQQLRLSLNHWLRSSDFLNIERKLRSLLAPTEDIRLILETSDFWLWRLPWQQWDWLQDYPRADIAFSSPEYRRRGESPVFRKRIRILAILGSSEGIDLQEEANFLQDLPDAETTFLANPSRQEFNAQLWNKQGWDILFFAGHSQTQGETGKIYLNENSTQNSLTIEQLEEALKAAIDQGLKLAIFNSCDGLGLALALERLHIPVVLVMREPVPNRVAQAFFDYFLEDFVQNRSPLYLSVRQARRKLQGLEDRFPGASWLPVICQNPAAEPLQWDTTVKPSPDRSITQNSARLRRRKRHELAISGLISLGIVLLLAGVRMLGILQPLELSTFDQMMQLRPDEGIDSRLLIIDITDKDIEMQQHQREQMQRVSTSAQTRNQTFDVSLSDRSLDRLLDVLTPYQPAVIGLDIYRDFPVAREQTTLTNHFQKLPIVAICKQGDIRDEKIASIDPPPEIPLERVGFSDFLTDDGEVLRRHLLSLYQIQWNSDSKCRVDQSLSTQVAFRYLNQLGIKAGFIRHGDYDDLQLGNQVYKVLRSRTSGYQKLPQAWGGNQILLNYRASDTIATRISLTEVLNHSINPDYVKDKIVLIGVTAQKEAAENDYWLTPNGVKEPQKMPGVVAQAHMISQIISAALDQRPLIWTWSGWIEILWILAWSLLASILTSQLGLRHQSIRRLLPQLGVMAALLLGGLYGACFVMLLSGGWIPFIPTALALGLTSSVVGGFHIYRAHSIRTSS